MAKDSSPPELHYHQETKLLIAFGDPDELKTIDDVLKTLPESNATRTELDSIRKEIKDLTAKVYEGVYNTTRAEMDSMGQEIKELQAKVNKLSPPAH
jgi:peptidoglycan hydrolase CwlO-like protein